MTHLGLYAATLVVFLALDIVWLKLVSMPMFRRRIGDLLAERPRLGVAAGFYALYVAGIVYFAQIPALAGGGPGEAFVNGALFGFLAYGTYEATNFATLRGWTWSMVISDTAWGAALSGGAAAAGFMLAT